MPKHTSIFAEGAAIGPARRTRQSGATPDDPNLPLGVGGLAHASTVTLSLFRGPERRSPE